MDFALFEKIAGSQFIWAIVAITLSVLIYRFSVDYVKSIQEDGRKREDKLIELYEKQRDESKEREAQLLGHLDKTTETLDTIGRSLEKLDEKVENEFRELWKVVAEKN